MPPPPAGRASGTERNAGRDWRWTRTAAALGDAGAVRIDVTVRAPGAAAFARTTMIRPPEPAAVR